MPYTRKFNSRRKPRSRRGKRMSRKDYVKNLIKMELSRQAENKTYQVYRPDVDVVNWSNANFNSYIFPVSPYAGFVQINQGTGDSGRIGNKIRLKNVTFKFQLRPNKYNSSSNQFPRPLVVKCWIIYDKENPNVIPSLGNEFLNLNNSSQALTGFPIDAISPVNTDRYRVVRQRTFKLGYASYDGTSASPGDQYFLNNDFKLNQNCTMNLTKHLIKNVTYNDNDSTPQNRGLFAVFECMNADGTAIGLGQIPANLSYMLNYEYEDF